MRKVLLSRISFSALMLTFLTFIFLFFNFTSAGNWDKPLSGGGSFVYVNETQTNSSVYWGDLLSVHSTQFNKLAGILSINTNWLENFIVNVDKWDNYYTKTQSNNRYIQSESDPYYFSNPNQYYNSTTLPITDLSGYYNKTEVNNILLDYYNETEVDLLINSLNNSFGDYYNKTEVDNLFNNIDLSSYYTKTEIDNKGYLTTESDPIYYSNPLGYYNSTTLPTEDLTIFYNKTEVDNLLNNYYPLSNPYGYLNESYDDSWINNTFYNQTQVDNLINGIDLSMYYTKTESDNIFVKLSNLVSLVGNWTLDKIGYYTKTEIDNKGYLQSESDPIYYSNPLGYYNSTTLPTEDLTIFYNKTEVDDLINSIDYLNSSELNSTQFETGEPATIKTSWLTSFIESVSKWASYYTKTEIDNRYSNNTGDQDLSTYIEGNMSTETITTITTLNGTALNFDGVNDYVTLNSNFGLSGTTQVTFSAWIHNTKNFVGWAGIITDATDDSNDLTLGAWDNAGMGYYLTTEVTNVHTGLVNSTGWHLLTGTYDGTSLKIYYDGVLKGTATDTTTTITSENFQIGKDRSLPRYWKGSIDEVLIFNRSLNSTEVEQLYNSGVGLYANTSIAPFNEGLVSGWHFDEGTGTTAYDLTGANNGTLTNGPSWVSGRVAHNESSTVPGEIGLIPWVSSTNFISTDYSLQWIGNTLKNPWFTSTELGNSTNRWNIFAWDTETVNLNVTNQTTMNNLTVNNLNVTNSFTGNCVNASILNGIIVGCND